MTALFNSICLLLLCNLVFAQHPSYRHYTVKDGLPSNEVYSCIQDCRGYIWLATDMGVCRYDGVGFKVFTTNDGMTDNTIFEIFEDYRGRIWFGTFNKRICYYEDGEIHAYPFNQLIADHMSGPSAAINSIYVDSLDRLHVFTTTSGYCIISGDGQIDFPVDAQNTMYKRVVRVEGTTHVFFNGFNQVLNPPSEQDKVIQIQMPGFPDDVKDYGLSFAGEEKGGKYLSAASMDPDNLMIGSGDVLIHLNRSQVNTFRNGSEVISQYVDDLGRLWIGSRNQGVMRLEPPYIFSDSVTRWFNGVSISSVMQDRQNGMWLTSLEEGVFYVPSGHIYIPLR